LPLNREKIERRTFLKSAAVLSAAALLKPSTVFGTAANSAVRVGVIGCGGRGAAVLAAMSAHTNTRVVALADLFEDRLLRARKASARLNARQGSPGIPPANIYRGSKAYLRLLDDKEVDAVLIATTAYAHPDILEAAIAAGKHAYCEKPAAIDLDGCRRIMDLSGRLPGTLSAVLGFQLRYATPYVEIVKRIRRGDIGEVVSAQLSYFSSGVPIKPRQGMPPDEARLRNHYHFDELSGGILLDQAIHLVDIGNWALNGVPLRATGAGGDKAALEFGNAWTNYQVIYKYPNDVNVSLHGTQVGPEFGDVCARFAGTKGIAEAHYSGGVFINGENAWDSGIARAGVSLTPEQIAAGASQSSLEDADANKVRSFIDSIETGNHLNELRSGCESTVSAILGRQAAARGGPVAWEEALASSERLDPGLDLEQFDQ
jgi:myo-inositol 2-dehydrogenase / D-chiro-inositol 1-dehydrogenase